MDTSRSAIAACNLCGGTDLQDQGTRRGVRCGRCNSLERTRAMKLLLDHHCIPKRDATILHFAPEPGLAAWFKEISPLGYDPVDLQPARHRMARKFDVLTDMTTLRDDHYDLILHAHVIEHLPINLAFFFYHLARALAPDGVQMFVAPLMGGHYDEYFGPLSREAAQARFGQHDHVRRLAVADFDRHLGAILRLDKNYDLTSTFSDEVLEACNIPLSQRKGLHGSTVFMTGKRDYRLQRS